MDKEERLRIIRESLESGEIVLFDTTEWSFVSAVDPGKTTGSALIRYAEDKPAEVVFIHQIENGEKGYWEFYKNAPSGYDNLSNVSESWVEHNVPGADRTPLRIEGQQWGIYGEDMNYQTPSEKALIPDEYLKHHNYWVPGKPHAMDAVRHALIFLVKKGHKPTIESLNLEKSEPQQEPGKVAKRQIDGQDYDFKGATTSFKESEPTKSTPEQTLNGAFRGYAPDGVEGAEVLFESEI